MWKVKIKLGKKVVVSNNPKISSGNNKEVDIARLIDDGGNDVFNPQDKRPLFKEGGG